MAFCLNRIMDSAPFGLSETINRTEYLLNYYMHRGVGSQNNPGWRGR